MTDGAVTKAETLRRVADRLGADAVPHFVYFSVAAWRSERRALVAACLAALPGCRLAVRSAVRGEDAAASGLAGHYRTELNVVPTPRALAGAVDRVVARYPVDDHGHQVLVQAMVADAERSGVVATRDPATGAPYWTIELATGCATDVVTSGRGEVRRVAVHHGAAPAVVDRAGYGAIVAAARAVERSEVVAGGCEIELAERSGGRVALLQVRPLPPVGGGVSARIFARGFDALARRIAWLARPRRGVAGGSTVLGLMPDWNPAELIGVHPSPLAAALFRVLVGDTTWQEARAAMGYQPVPNVRLVQLLAGRPYVDVRASFNSFVPAGLARRTRAVLVDGWLDRLRAAPELHDRVELDVAVTVRDAGAAHRDHAPGLRADERRDWLAALAALTTRAVAPGGSLAAAHRALAAPLGRPAVSLADVGAALARCRTHGARPFAIVARHAFMAERLVRSLVTEGALAPERLDAFRRSLATVTGRFAADWRRVADGSLAHVRFVARYGHLRPGAFDVTSLPYALRGHELWERAPSEPPAPVPFVLRASERRAVDALLGAAAIGADAHAVVAWAARAIVAREEAKFLFTRRLSAILEDLAAWGRRHDLDREDLALLDLADLTRAARARPDRHRLQARIAAARRRRTRERAFRLGVLVRDARDLEVVWEPPALPNFVTDRTVVAPPARIDGRTLARGRVADRIVCIESADPGFDWIFGCGIAGLVTRFGGGNSHMAVRCLELGVPAALGVGERIFERVARAAIVELRCGERVLRDVGPGGREAPVAEAACAV